MCDTESGEVGDGEPGRVHGEEEEEEGEGEGEGGRSWLGVGLE